SSIPLPISSPWCCTWAWPRRAAWSPSSRASSAPTAPASPPDRSQKRITSRQERLPAKIEQVGVALPAGLRPLVATGNHLDRVPNLHRVRRPLEELQPPA